MTDRSVKDNITDESKAIFFHIFYFLAVTFREQARLIGTNHGD